MKWLFVFVAIVMAVKADEYCFKNVEAVCSNGRDDTSNCTASYSGFASGVEHLQAYANDQLIKSFDYLLLSANFGTYVKNRPGFEKQFRGLSDTAWGRAISLIKHITKRGGEHNFATRHTSTEESQKNRVLELSEFDSMAYALDAEKTLATQAHKLHERYSHINHNSHKYDPEVAHYLEEKFIEDQAETVRRFSGYTNDLKKLLKEPETEKGKPETKGPKDFDISLALYMFDGYLQKQ